MQGAIFLSQMLHDCVGTVVHLAKKVWLMNGSHLSSQTVVCRDNEIL